MKKQLDNIYRKDFRTIRTGIFSQSQRELFNTSTKKENTDELIMPWHLISKIKNNIIDDYKLLHISKKYFKNSKILNKLEIVGNKDLLYLMDNSSKILPGVILDTTDGPIVINKNVTIMPFSYLKGPIYIGENTTIKDARIYGGVSIGNSCRIAGELENCLIGNFTNKNHESAIVHSYVGDWCNIGGYFKTADLNLDYSTIKIHLMNNKKIDTKMQKLGVIISDYVRIGAGMLTNPGTFIDFGCSLIQLPKISGYFDPFTLYHKDNFCEINSFLSQISVFMQRRDMNVTDELVDKCIQMYNKTNILLQC
ncbi:MAG: hypothetical protein ABI315_07865 [Bacteroidia bacterium]